MSGRRQAEQMGIPLSILEKNNTGKDLKKNVSNNKLQKEK